MADGKQKDTTQKARLPRREKSLARERTKSCECHKLNQDKIKLLSIIADLKAEIKTLKPVIPPCQICEQPMVKYSRVEADGEEDWVRYSQWYYCRGCCELEQLVEMTEPGENQ